MYEPNSLASMFSLSVSSLQYIVPSSVSDEKITEEINIIFQNEQKKLLFFLHAFLNHAALHVNY